MICFIDVKLFLEVCLYYNISFEYNYNLELLLLFGRFILNPNCKMRHKENIIKYGIKYFLNGAIHGYHMWY